MRILKYMVLQPRARHIVVKLNAFSKPRTPYDFALHQAMIFLNSNLVIYVGYTQLD